MHLTNNQDVSGLAPGTAVRIGFSADEAVALPEGPVAAD